MEWEKPDHVRDPRESQAAQLAPRRQFSRKDGDISVPPGRISLGPQDSRNESARQRRFHSVFAADKRVEFSWHHKLGGSAGADGDIPLG